METFNRLIT